MTLPLPRRFFASAEFYDALINWPARLNRELPFLKAQLGPPDKLGLLDAGCGSGRHAVALHQAGYRVTGVDVERQMLAFARKLAAEQAARIAFCRSSFAALSRHVTGPFDGVYCLGNALAATGTARAARAAIVQFGRLVRRGGRLVLQVINFAEVRRTAHKGGYVRGPQVARLGGVEYLSMKVFGLAGPHITLTRLILWKNGDQWQCDTSQARLLPIEAPQLLRWLGESGFRLVGKYGDYAGKPFDRTKSGDLIVVAERVAR